MTSKKSGIVRFITPVVYQVLGEPVGNDLLVAVSLKDLIEAQKSYEKTLSLSRKNILEEVKEKVTLLNKEEFIEIRDNDSHRYQIPRSKRDAWFKWCEIGEKDSEDEKGWEVPDWAERIDGMPTTDVRQYNQALFDVLEQLQQLGE